MSDMYLSYFIETETPVYGGEKGTIVFDKIRSIAKGDTSNNLKISFPVHIGTHIDFPYHFDDSGKKANDYPPSFWIFNTVGFLQCSIEEVPGRLDELPETIEILILKTGFGAKRGEDEYWSAQPVIPAFFADLFRKRFPALRVFGFDLISLTSILNREEGKKAHIAFLLQNEFLVLEDMNLGQLDKAPQKIIVSPLQLSGADGTPCTVIAFG
jgi:kynurenine formamidase